MSAIAYLFSEFSLRPIAARALSGEERVHPSRFGVRRRMLVFWGLGTGTPVVGLVVVAILSLTLSDGTLTKLAVVVLALGAVVLTFGFLVTWLNARAVVSPLLAVRDAMDGSRTGSSTRTSRCRCTTGLSCGRLQAGFNQMVRGLREREHVRDMFGRHVGRDVADAAASGEVELGGKTCVVSRPVRGPDGSTTLAAEREPAEVVELLNQFFGVVVEEVDARIRGWSTSSSGTPSWRSSAPRSSSTTTPASALAAARAMTRRLADEVPDLTAGIGVATGRGGGRQRRRGVALRVHRHRRRRERRRPAHRAAKEVDGRLLVAWDSVEAAGGDEAGHWRKHEPVTLRGRREETVTAVPAT